MRSGLSIVDILTSHYATTAILAAVIHRNQHPENRGQYIDVALLDSMVATLSHRGMQYLISGKATPRRGNVGAGGSPSGAFRCSDGLIVLTVGNDLQWRRFCAAIGRRDLEVDARFKAASLRIENREALSSILEAPFAAHDKKYWLDLLDHADIPSGPVNELPEVFGDAQVRDRGMIVRACHPESGSVDLIANPIRYSSTPIDRYVSPPMLGQHTDEVLKELLGFDEVRLKELRDTKVI